MNGDLSTKRLQTALALSVDGAAEPRLNRRQMLFAGFVVQIVLGLLYAWSIFVLPLEKEFGWVRAQTSLAFTTSLIFFPVGMLLGGRLTDTRGIRVAGTLSALLLSTGFLLTSLTSSIPWLIISYGVIAGCGIGVGSNAMSALVSWFPDKRGLSAGLLSMGFGLGGLVLGSLANVAVTHAGWRFAFLFLAATTLVVCLSGSRRVSKAPPGWKPESWEPNGPANTAPAFDYTPLQMLEARLFWFMELWMLLVSAAGVMMIGHIVPMAVELGIDQTSAVLTMGILSLSNGLGRAFYGALSDRLGRAPTMFLSALLMTVAILLTIPLTRALGYPGLLISAVIIGSSYGGGIPQLTAIVMQYFGARHFGVNLGIASCHIVVGGVVGPLLAGYLRTITGSYDIPFTLVGLAPLIGCMMPWLFLRAERQI